MVSKIDFGTGVKSKYIDIDLSKDISLEEQIDNLKEDLLQVVYDNDYLIDLGWYPEFDEKGSFKISVVKDYQWDNPAFQKNFSTLDELERYLCECIEVIQMARKK